MAMVSHLFFEHHFKGNSFFSPVGRPRVQTAEGSPRKRGFGDLGEEHCLGRARDTFFGTRNTFLTLRSSGPKGPRALPRTPSFSETLSGTLAGTGRRDRKGGRRMHRNRWGFIESQGSLVGAPFAVRSMERLSYLSKASARRSLIPHKGRPRRKTEPQILKKNFETRGGKGLRPRCHQFLHTQANAT